MDGQRRLARPAGVLAATGLLGGVHVTLGLLALVVTTGALSAVMPSAGAHVLGSLTFGIGFVFLTIGRSELFTENFLIPGVAIAHTRRLPPDATRRELTSDRLSEELQATPCSRR